MRIPRLYRNNGLCAKPPFRQRGENELPFQMTAREVQKLIQLLERKLPQPVMLPERPHDPDIPRVIVMVAVVFQESALLFVLPEALLRVAVVHGKGRGVVPTAILAGEGRVLPEALALSNQIPNARRTFGQQRVDSHLDSQLHDVTRERLDVGAEDSRAVQLVQHEHLQEHVLDLGDADTSQTADLAWSRPIASRDRCRIRGPPALSARRSVVAKVYSFKILYFFLSGRIGPFPFLVLRRQFNRIHPVAVVRDGRIR